MEAGSVGTKLGPKESNSVSMGDSGGKRDFLWLYSRSSFVVLGGSRAWVV